MLIIVALCLILKNVVYCRDPLAQFEMEKREHTMKMKKMEQEMEEVFEMKVVEKQQKLKDIEQDVCLFYLSVCRHLFGHYTSDQIANPI